MPVHIHYVYAVIAEGNKVYAQSTIAPRASGQRAAVSESNDSQPALVARCRKRIAASGTLPPFACALRNGSYWAGLGR